MKCAVSDSAFVELLVHYYSELTMRWLWSVFLVLVSCRTMQSSTELLRSADPPVRPQIKVEFDRGVITLDVRFTTLRDSTSRAHHFVFGIDSIIAHLQLRGRSQFDTTLYLALINGTSGLREKVDSIGTAGLASWTNPLGLAIDTLRWSITVHTLMRDRYTIQFDTVMALPADSTPPFMSVTPFIDLQTDSNITFALLAQRNRGVGEDYHPTSERLRLEIFDEHGTLRFASNAGMSFLQQVMPVEPRRRGELKRYTFEWPGFDNEGNLLPPGRYIAVLSLVAKPYPYTASIPFDWKGVKR